MITEAEKRSDAKQSKLYHKRSHNDRNDSHRISSPNMRKHSRSRNRDCVEKYNVSDYSQRCRKLKQIFQIPKDNNDYYRQTMPSSSGVKNWKKDKGNEKEYQVIELPTPETKDVNLGNINSTNETDKDKDIDTCTLTEAEMNKLGARIIKAELMGDDVCFLFYKCCY